MTTIDVSALTKRIESIVSEWVDYALRNQLSLRDRNNISEAGILKMIQMQSQINEIEADIIRQRGFVKRTTLHIPDSSPTIPSDEESQPYTAEQYSSAVNALENEYNEMLDRIAEVFPENNHQAIRYHLVDTLSRMYQDSANHLADLASMRLTSPFPYRKIYNSSKIAERYHQPPRPTAYEFDVTGTKPENRVVELRTITKSPDSKHQFILPRYLPFFMDGLQIHRITPNGDRFELFINEDFVLSGFFGEMSNHTLGGKLVATSILFDDIEIDGHFEISYQTLGGDYLLEDDGYTAILANYVESPFLKTYGEIVGKPLTMHTMRHNIHIDDMVGLDAFMPIFVDMNNTLKTLVDQNSHALSEDLFNDLTRHATNLMNVSVDINRKFNDLSNDLTGKVDHISREFDSLERNILFNTEQKFNELSNSLTSSMTSKFDTFQSNINGQLEQFERTTNSSIEDKLLEFQGRFRDDVNANIEQLRESIVHEPDIRNWISEDFTRLMRPHLTEYEMFVEGVDIFKEETKQSIKNATNTALNAMYFIENTLPDKLTELRDNISADVRSKVSGVTQDVERLEERLNTNTSELNGKIDKKVSKDDPNYVKYQNGKRIRLDGIDFINGDRVNGISYSTVTKYGNDWTATLSQNLLLFSTPIASDADIYVKGTGQQHYTSIADLISKFKQSKRDITALTSAISTINGITPSRPSEPNKLLKLDGSAVAHIAGGIKFGANGTSGKIYADGGGLTSTVPYISSDFKFKSDTRFNGVTGFPSVKEMLLNFRSTLATTTSTATSAKNQADTLHRTVTNIAQEVDRLNEAYTNMPDRVQQMNDHQQTASMRNKAPVIQNGGEIYLGGELILTRPQSLGGYNNNANDRIHIKYINDTGLGGKTVQFSSPIKVPNYSVTSDVRLKANIRLIEDSQNKLRKLSGYTYQLTESNSPSAGVLAQEVEKVLPEIVSIDDDGFKSVQYQGLIALLINVVNEQDERIKVLENMIKEKKDD